MSVFVNQPNQRAYLGGSAMPLQRCLNASTSWSLSFHCQTILHAAVAEVLEREEHHPPPPATASLSSLDTAFSSTSDTAPPDTTFSSTPQEEAAAVLLLPSAPIKEGGL
jgi:hypothetical protein